jgi:hypothetical protein
MHIPGVPFEKQHRASERAKGKGVPFMDPRPKKSRASWLPGSVVPLGVALAFLTLAGCRDEVREGDQGEEMMETEVAALTLGPADGFDLPATDLQRVAVGSMAPDFTLLSLDGDPVTLSSFRGSRDVILVFYRGHW